MSHIEQEFETMVSNLVKPGSDIISDLSPEGAHLWHMATGVSGESGELLDTIKKTVLYQKPLDIENIIEELGDIEFFMEGMRSVLGISRKEVLKHNVEKLGKRYSQGTYSNQQAQSRADKAGA